MGITPLEPRGHTVRILWQIPVSLRLDPGGRATSTWIPKHHATELSSSRYSIATNPTGLRRAIAHIAAWLCIIGWVFFKSRNAKVTPAWGVLQVFFTTPSWGDWGCSPTGTLILVKLAFPFSFFSFFQCKTVHPLSSPSNF